MATYSGIDLIKQMNSLKVPPGCLAIWGLGQMGVAVKGDDTIIYIDPCLSDIAAEVISRELFARGFEPPIQPEEVTNATYVLCSHEHADHTDPLTLGPLAQASPDATFVISGWAQNVLDEAKIPPGRRMVAPEKGSAQLGNMRLTSVPAAHYNLDHDERGYRWLGFVIEWNGVTFYHSGDTLVYPGYLERLKALPQADIAMLAVNGRDAYRDQFNVVGNLWPKEAAWLTAECGWVSADRWT